MTVFSASRRLLSAVAAIAAMTAGGAALAQGRVMPLRAVLDKVEREYPGQAVKIEFEDDDGRYIYEIKVLRNSGNIVKLKIDASDGRVLSARERDKRPGDN